MDEEEDEQAAGEASVAGVWLLGNVEAKWEEPKGTRSGARRGATKPTTTTMTATQNQFVPLVDREEGEADDKNSQALETSKYGAVVPMGLLTDTQ